MVRGESLVFFAAAQEGSRSQLRGAWWRSAGRWARLGGCWASGVCRVSCVVCRVSLLSALFGLIWELGVGRAKPAGNGGCSLQKPLLFAHAWHLALGTCHLVRCRTATHLMYFNSASPLKWLLNGSSRATPGPGVPLDELDRDHDERTRGPRFSSVPQRIHRRPPVGPDIMVALRGPGTVAPKRRPGTTRGHRQSFNGRH